MLEKKSKISSLELKYIDYFLRKKKKKDFPLVRLFYFIFLIGLSTSVEYAKIAQNLLDLPLLHCTMARDIRLLV